MADYISRYTGEEIDERLAAVDGVIASLEELTEAIAAKYTKPSSGIPETDLDSDVQAALALARTAIQSLAGYYTSAQVDGIVQALNNSIAAKYAKPGSGIPASDLAAAVQTSLGKADTAYQKPSGGIPSSDMASAVQTSLGKADSAYQKPASGIPASDIAPGVIPDEIATVNVTVDNNTGSPTATGSVSGSTLSLAFQNLKGAKGDTGATGAQGPQGPIGPQGQQGNTGSSVDYPYELVNNLTTDDATKGLSAAQGVVLEGEVSQLLQQVGPPVSEVGAALKECTVNLHEGYYISPEGNVGASNDYVYSDPIPLLKGQSIGLYTKGSGMAPISLTDATGSFYTQLMPSGNMLGTYYGYSYKASADCYVAISGNKKSANNVLACYVSSFDEDPYVDAHHVVIGATSRVIEPEFTEITGKFIGAYGKIETNAQYRYTSPISLIAGDVLEFDFTGGSGVLTLAEVFVPDYYYTEIRKDTASVTSLTHVTYTADSDKFVAMTGKVIANVKITHAGPVGTVQPITEILEDLAEKTRNEYSEAEYMELPIPSRARINVIASSLSTSKTSPVVGKIEYHDAEHGISFTKNVTLTAQGSSSMSYVEKNQTLDFDDCSIKFGHWVPQDSFHLKAYYIDVFRGINNAMYNFAEEVIRLKGCRANRVLESGTPSLSNGAGNLFTDFGTDALCHPDGFPVELYLNGVYYGLFALNLKKHRDNYSMSKTNANQILMDGEIGRPTFWGGTINWTKFEIRNPKDLVCMDGSDYDGDNPQELIDSTSTYYDSTNANHVRSAAVKATLQSLSEARGYINLQPTVEAKRAAFEATFDLNMFLVYYVVSQVIDNYDGFYKNWVWTVYTGYAAPNFYDMDSLFGRYWNGSHVFHQPNWGNVENYSDTNSISHMFVNLYSTEIAALYGTLREAGIISVEHIMSHIEKWLERIGRAALSRNLEAWPTTPSYRANSDTDYDDGTETGEGMYDSPERVRLWLTGRIEYLDNLYGYNQQNP